MLGYLRSRAVTVRGLQFGARVYGKQLLLQLEDEGRRLAQGGSSLVGQLKYYHESILRVAPPIDQSTLLMRVQSTMCLEAS